MENESKTLRQIEEKENWKKNVFGNEDDLEENDDNDDWNQPVSYEKYLAVKTGLDEIEARLNNISNKFLDLYYNNILN